MLENIILDLDETCIFSVEIKDYETDEKLRKLVDKRMTQLRYYNTDAFIIFERPYLQEFLTFLFKKFKVSVWTYGTKSYGEFIIENIICPPKKKRVLQHSFFYDECETSRKTTGCFKHLDYFFSLDKNHQWNNTLIIDDNENVYSNQVNQILKIKPFNITKKNAEKDKTLVDIQKFLKEQCK